MPTPRAADLGYAPRYFGIVLASSIFRFGGVSTLPPQAANANRWAAGSKAKTSLAGHEVLLQLSRTSSAAGCKMNSTPSYRGGASSASWHNRSFLARPHLLRMVSRVTRNHAGATASCRSGQSVLLARVSRRPTPRAADLGYAPRFQAFFVASSFSCFGSESTLPPQAANASRWAVSTGLRIM